MNTDTGLQLDLLGTLRRRRMLIAVVAGCVFFVGYWVAMALPNEYRAYATLLVEPQAVSGRLVTPGVRETDLNERLHLMTAQILSRPRLSKVIDELELYEDESKDMTREEVIDLMRGQISVVPVLPELEVGLRNRRDVEINTFRVQFTGSTPTVAAQVAQHLANDFIQEHIEERVQSTAKSLDFIAVEQQRLASEIQRVEAAIAQVKDDNPGSLPEDMVANQQMISLTMSSLRVAQRELDLARSDAAFWENQAADAVAAGGPPGDVTPAKRLQQLHLALDAYRARGYTDKHPDMIIAMQEIAEIRESMKQGDGEDDETSPGNLAQRSALAQQQRAEARIEAGKSEVARLQKQVDEVRTQVEATPRVAERLEALTREHSQLTENLRDYNNRRLEAEVQSNLERRQLGEQFRVLEPAFAPEEHASPNRLIIIVVGLVVGLGLGVGAAVAAEAADSSVHGALELQRELGLPVLASIPNILLPPDIAARRRRWVRNVAAAAGLSLFCLLGGAATYLYVNGSFGDAEEEIEQERTPNPVPRRLREPGARAPARPQADADDEREGGA